MFSLSNSTGFISSAGHFRSTGRRPAWAGLWGVLLASCLASSPDAATPESTVADREAYRTLASPMTMRAEGQTIGQVVDQLATTRTLNLWRQRDLDWDAELPEISLGPSVAAALQQVVDRLDATLVVRSGVVLVGRSAWIERNLAELHRAELGGAQLNEASPLGSQRRTTGASVARPAAHLVSIRWPDLITPSELVRLARRADGVHTAELSPSDIASRPEVDDEFPHDLWPAGQLIRVAPESVESLVRSQFAVQSEPAESWQDRYPGVIGSGRWGRRVRTAVGAGRMSTANGTVTLTGTAATHRVALQTLLQAFLARAKSATAGKAATFDFKVENQPASHVLESLAQAAGVPLQVEIDEPARVQQRVTFSAEKKTLEQLAQQAASEAGLQIQFQADRWIIR
ncbi:hypothetical protein [Crateriforma conspicua]|uniref:Uncharacterized protein n=1 Tax=Crateriforma conspicua TaxID=2527996 RepID=A0A5C6FQB8_9PLAN|nr:hypothetical protein [Crateriforma conspicua]TWU65332.1 hypothetical protein V7x_08790 [Crateriforma conspicua]